MAAVAVTFAVAVAVTFAVAVAFTVMMVTDSAGGFESAGEVGTHSGLGIALGTNHNLYAAAVKNIHSAATHAASNDDVHTAVGQEVW